MLARLGVVVVAVWASLACAAAPKRQVAPVVEETSEPEPQPAPSIVNLCTMDEDCPQGQRCCEQMGSPVCC